MTVCSKRVAGDIIGIHCGELEEHNLPTDSLKAIAKDYGQLWDFCMWLKDWIDTELCDIDDAEIIKAQLEKYNILEGRHG